MKGVIAVILIAIVNSVACTTLFVLASENGSGNTAVSVTQHAQEQIDVIVETTETAESIECHEHVFGDYELVTFDKTKDNFEVRSCACGETEKRLFVCSHVETKTLITESTCCEHGTEKIVCAFCEEILSVTYFEKTGCDYGDWVITKKATCVDKGVTQRQCKICGSIEESTLDFGNCANELIYMLFRTDINKYTLFYKCSICEKETTEIKYAYRDYSGTLRIDAVGLIVDVYRSADQEVCDRENSACYFDYWGDGNFSDRVKVIADHKHQGFDKIKKVSVGDVATLVNFKYRCVEKFTGHNMKKQLTDDNGNDITTHSGDLFMYTCNENSQNITIVAWELIE